MIDPGYYETFLENAQKTASNFFEAVTETVNGKAEDLRDGTELDPVSLPRDLAAHRNAQTEWWYYTGHAERAGTGFRSNWIITVN